MLFLIILIASFFGNKNEQQVSILPTPTPVASSYSVHTFSDIVAIDSTIPSDGESNVSLDQKIIVYLNKKVSLKDISFFITPDVQFNISQNDQAVVIQPTSPLSSGTTYTFSLDYKLHPIAGTFEFTTVGPTPTLQPDTQIHIQDIRNNWNRQNHPDLFLYNQTPYDSDTFSVTSDFTPEPTGHFYFTIAVKTNSSQAKLDFIKWAKSLGLTDDQINSLDIRGLGGEKITPYQM